MRRLILLILLLNSAFLYSGNVSIAPHDYSINLMWINRKLDLNQKYIYPAQDEKKLNDKFLKYVYMWAYANKDSVVYIWFDSYLNTASAIENTRKFIDDYSSSEMAPIVFRDIRDLSEVKKHPKVFSDKTPIFYRVDLLRVIAQIHDVSKRITSNFVYSDFDIDPLSKEEIFDKNTVNYLKKFGTVMSYDPLWLGYENGFSIVSNNKKLLEAMQYIMVDLNIQRGYKSLQGKFYKQNHILEIIDSVNGVDRKELSSISSPVDNYSINFLCLNFVTYENQPYIRSGSDKEELEDYFFKNLYDWAVANPEAKINIWFDGDVVSEYSVKNTQKFIENNFPDVSNIVLKDIRSLQSANNILNTLGYKGDIAWAKEELLEATIAIEDVLSGRSYSIFGSLIEVAEYRDGFNLHRLSKEELFNDESISDLQKFGLHIKDQFEIRCRIFGGNTDGLPELLSSKWLRPNTEKLQKKLRGVDCCCNSCSTNIDELQQVIYFSYQAMFAYFYHIADFGKLYVEKFDPKSNKFVTSVYDKFKHGFEPFGSDRRKFIDTFRGYDKLPVSSRNYVWAPTKKIAYPKATLMYNDNDPVRSIKSV